MEMMALTSLYFPSMALLTTLQADVIHSITRFQRSVFRCRHIHPLTSRIPLKEARCVCSGSCGITCAITCSTKHGLYLSHQFLYSCSQPKPSDPSVHFSENTGLVFFSTMWRLFPLPPCQHHYTKGRPGLKISRRVNILETADSLEARRAKQIDYTLQHTIPAGPASVHVSIIETSVFLSLCTSSFISTY